MNTIAHRGEIMTDRVGEERAREAGAGDDDDAPTTPVPEVSAATGSSETETETGTDRRAATTEAQATTDAPAEHEATTDAPAEHEAASDAPAEHEAPSDAPAEHEAPSDAAAEHEAAKKPETAPETAKAAPKRRTLWTRLKRLGLAAIIGGPIAVLALWVAIHEIPWLGPWVADTLRATIGAEAVTWLEETAYGVQDRVNRVFRANEAPKARWAVPAGSQQKAKPRPSASASASADAGPPPVPDFELKNVGPSHKRWSAPGDGVWVPVVDPRHPEDETRMFKTLLHPDRNRSWAELFVVAVDLRRVTLKPVIGYQEPKAVTAEARKKLRHRSDARPSKIDSADLPRLIGAFNGGFKLEHGRWGMAIGGITVVPPRKYGCTLALLPDGLHIGTWKTLGARKEEMAWYRQTPPCMYEDGKLHPALHDPESRNWGATLEGKTVIRRSAIGLSKDRSVLYMGISNSTTAQSLAKGMHHAGAHSVAQLDVNWSYPKFVLFEGEGDAMKAVPLAEGFKFHEKEYFGRRSMRDFFYLTQREATKSAVGPDAPAAPAPAPLPSASASASTAPSTAPSAAPSEVPSSAPSPASGEAAAPSATGAP